MSPEMNMGIVYENKKTDGTGIKCCNGNGFYGHCTSCYGR